jgi:hypothetical protein
MDIFVPRQDSELETRCRLCKRPLSTLFYMKQDRVCEVCWRKINQENNKDWNPNNNRKEWSPNGTT